MEDKIEEYYNKSFNIDIEYIKKLDKLDKTAQIGNVLRGLEKECFCVAHDLDNSKEIDFIYVNESEKITGTLLKLKFREQYFYEYLLMYAFDLSKDYPSLQPLNVYNTFIHFLRTILESRGFITITSTEIIGENPTIISLNPIEFIKNFNLVDFYKKLLNSETLIEIKPFVDYVYLMINIQSGHFKIGQSKKPVFREKTLQAQEPEIALLKIWEVDKAAEKILHKKYIQKRVRGEWFKLDFKDIYYFNETVEEIKNLT